MNQKSLRSRIILRPDLHVLFFIAFSSIIVTKWVSSIPIDNSIAGVPRIHCGRTQIDISFDTVNSFEGRVYIKGYADQPNCVIRGTGKPGVNMPITFDKCGVRRARQVQPTGIGVSTVVIVSFHPIFLTKVDRAYRVNCFYMEATKTVEQELFVSMLTTSLIDEQLPMPICRYEILRGIEIATATPVRFAQIGDSVFHKWTCASDNPGMFCMRVHTCKVGDGQGGQPVLILDERGCAVDRYVLRNLQYMTDLMAGQESHVFKFADRPALYFDCQIELTLRDASFGCVQVQPQCPEPNRSFNSDGGNQQITNANVNGNNNNNQFGNNNNNNNGQGGFGGAGFGGGGGAGGGFGQQFGGGNTGNTGGSNQVVQGGGGNNGGQNTEGPQVIGPGEPLPAGQGGQPQQINGPFLRDSPSAANNKISWEGNVSSSNRLVQLGHFTADRPPTPSTSTAIRNFRPNIPKPTLTTEFKKFPGVLKPPASVIANSGTSRTSTTNTNRNTSQSDSANNRLSIANNLAGLYGPRGVGAGKRRRREVLPPRPDPITVGEAPSGGRIDPVTGQRTWKADFDLPEQQLFVFEIPDDPEHELDPEAVYEDLMASQNQSSSSTSSSSAHSHSKRSNNNNRNKSESSEVHVSSSDKKPAVCVALETVAGLMVLIVLSVIVSLVMMGCFFIRRSNAALAERLKLSSLHKH